MKNKHGRNISVSLGEKAKEFIKLFLKFNNIFFAPLAGLCFFLWHHFSCTPKRQVSPTLKSVRGVPTTLLIFEFFSNILVTLIRTLPTPFYLENLLDIEFLLNLNFKKPSNGNNESIRHMKQGKRKQLIIPKWNKLWEPV